MLQRAPDVRYGGRRALLLFFLCTDDTVMFRLLQTIAEEGTNINSRVNERGVTEDTGKIDPQHLDLQRGAGADEQGG